MAYKLLLEKRSALSDEHHLHEIVREARPQSKNLSHIPSHNQISSTKYLSVALMPVYCFGGMGINSQPRTLRATRSGSNFVLSRHRNERRVTNE